MDFNRIDLAQLAERVAREVLGRVQFETAEDENVQGTVALFTSFVPSKKACAQLLTERFGMGIDCMLFDGVQFEAPGCFCREISTDEDHAELFERLAGAADVVLVTPRLGLIYRLAEGDDAGMIEQAVLRPLLWGRRVTLLLDFDIPRFKRATFFAKLVDALDALTAMGVRIVAYHPSAEKEDQPRAALVTEPDVLAAHGSGQKRILCEKNAIITPLAREKARELDVSLDY